MKKRVGILAMILAAGMAVLQPTAAFAQDRDGYRGWGDRHEDRHYRDRDRREDRAWRQHEFREREWRDQDRRYYRYYDRGYYRSGYYAPGLSFYYGSTPAPYCPR